MTSVWRDKETYIKPQQTLVSRLGSQPTEYEGGMYSMVSACLSAYIHVPACEHIHTGTKIPDSDLVHFNTFQKIKKHNKTWINSQVVLQFCISRCGYVISYEIHENVLEHKKHTPFKGAE
jgi:hypothetical protein